MGSTQAILFPGIAHSTIKDLHGTLSSSGGVVVLLPELSMALSIGGDASSDVLTTSLPRLKAPDVNGGSKGRRGRHNLIDRFFSDNTSSDRNGMLRFIYSTLQGGKHAVMWHEGGNEINFFNLAHSSITTLSLNSLSKVSSMRFLRCIDGSEEFLLSLEGRSEATVLRIHCGQPGSSTNTLSMSVIGSPEHNNVAELFNMNGTAVGSTQDLESGVSTVGGNHSTYAGKYDFDSKVYRTWQRNTVSCDVNRSTASSTAVYNVLLEHEKAGMCCRTLFEAYSYPVLRFLRL